ncbi:hypothetical protein B7759_01288 [Burkholderia glumae]|nr:hypothetical protein KS03_2802 [Burkholderia glumae LMG 2196 = ATCC 33617]QKM54404.1 hypothetical protein CG017_02438 [Burkholderia glumae]QTP32712.1 hypothetical protein B7759_01288 [Burkholderia glumae]
MEHAKCYWLSSSFGFSQNPAPEQGIQAAFTFHQKVAMKIEITGIDLKPFEKTPHEIVGVVTGHAQVFP